MHQLAEVRTHVRSYVPYTSDLPYFEHSAPSILCGTSQSVPLPYILRQLPSRHTCDKMLTVFFSKLDPALC